MKMPYTKEEINRIIGLKRPDGTTLDIFDLWGKLLIGNTDPDDPQKVN